MKKANLLLIALFAFLSINIITHSKYSAVTEIYGMEESANFHVLITNDGNQMVTDKKLVDVKENSLEVTLDPTGSNSKIDYEISLDKSIVSATYTVNNIEYTAKMIDNKIFLSEDKDNVLKNNKIQVKIKLSDDISSIPVKVTARIAK